ncbi:MAG: hypothetical protein IJQ73_14180 [Kiritimatiellae bacterium]|nr:hypothetical protein [Kiritimatiellia bacterium]
MNYTRATTAALAAVLLLGQAQSAMANATYNDAVIFCKVTIAENGEENGDKYLSVTIPATEGATDSYGNPATIWNLGTVMAGGIYDSFYNGGPGHFRVQNSGNMPAYVYVSTGWNEPKFQGHQDTSDYYYDSLLRLFENVGSMEPVAMPKILDQLLEWYYQTDNNEVKRCYALAVSTEITGRVPVWRPLSWFYDGNDVAYYNGADATSYDPNYRRYTFQTIGTKGEGISDYSAYLAYMPVGETQLFDLKFWAPPRKGEDHYWFPIRIEASAFKLWDHDR